MSQLPSSTFMMEQDTEEMSHEDFGTLGSNREEQETQVTPEDGDGDSSRNESADETTTAEAARPVVPKKRHSEINDEAPTPPPKRGRGRPRRNTQANDQVQPKEKVTKKTTVSPPESIKSEKEDEDFNESQDEGNTVKLKVVSQAYCEMYLLVRMRRTAKFQKLMKSFCQQFKLAEGKSRFFYDGKRIHPTQGTPEDLGMEDNDIIEVHTAQSGGQRK